MFFQIVFPNKFIWYHSEQLSLGILPKHPQDLFRILQHSNWWQISNVKYSWTPLCWTRLSRTSRYLEQNRISLGFALVFSVIYYGLSRTRLSRTPRYLELFVAPLSSNQPPYLELHYVTKKHWSTSVRKCSQSTSWQNVLKAEKQYWRVHGKETKSDWLDLPLRMPPTSLSRTPAISNYFSIPLRVRDSGVLLWTQDFQCVMWP